MAALSSASLTGRGEGALMVREGVETLPNLRARRTKRKVLIGRPSRDSRNTLPTGEMGRVAMVSE